MVELFILVIIVFNYVVPFEGLFKLSKSEKKVLDNYQHVQIKITSDTEDLIGDGGDIGTVQNENGEFATMSVLGDLDSDSNSDDKDFTDVNLGDLYDD